MNYIFLCHDEWKRDWNILAGVLEHDMHGVGDWMGAWKGVMLEGDFRAYCVGSCSGWSVKARSVWKHLSLFARFF